MGEAHNPDEPRDDLFAALDFSVADDAPHGSGLDGYPPVEEELGGDGPVFTVTNPPGSVTVSAVLDGRIRHIQLSPRAAELSETDLAAEVVVVAGLAAQDARAAQYAAVLEGMRECGHDDAATRDFLHRDLGLPSPEQAQADRARVFSARYRGDHD